MTMSANSNLADNQLSELNLRVTVDATQGHRLSMEDRYCVAYHATAEEPNNPMFAKYAYFGVFDGHGGAEASTYAKRNLMDHITSHEGFWSREDDVVLDAIRKGFLEAQQEMERERSYWKRTRDGLLSNAGTTATVAFFRNGKLFICHVGDSAIILGYQDPDDPTSNGWKAKKLTRDHKPDDPEEVARILESGGNVAPDKNGHLRVVWNRTLPQRTEVPLLMMSRALGDFWSYRAEQGKFAVSPDPETSVIEIDVESFRCLVIASDGVLDMLRPQQVIDNVYQAHRSNLSVLQPGSIGRPSYINPARNLVTTALKEWEARRRQADNATAVAVMIDPPCSSWAEDLVRPQIPMSIPPGVSVPTVTSTSTRDTRVRDIIISLERVFSESTDNGNGTRVEARRARRNNGPTISTRVSDPVAPSSMTAHATRTRSTRMTHVIEPLTYFQGTDRNLRKRGTTCKTATAQYKN